MEWLFITLGALAALFVLVLAALYFLALHVKPKRLRIPLALPNKSLQKRMKDADMAYTMELTRQILEMPHEKIELRSFDGLRLAARLMMQDEAAPLCILCHGYRGHAAADFRGIFQQVWGLGYNILLINERAHWESDGGTISLGLREKRDVQCWANYAAERFPGKPIALYGVSMGAATVLSTTAMELPASVRCVVADCGFSTPRGIVKFVLGQLHLGFLYPLVFLAMRIFGRVDLNDPGALAAVKNCKLPILFIHGEKDTFVPCEMSREMYEAAAGEKQLVTFPNATHLHSCLVDPEKYLAAIGPFLAKHLRGENGQA